MGAFACNGDGDDSGDTGATDSTSDVPSDVTWSATALPDPPMIDSWTSVYATSKNAIWLAGHMFFEYDGTDWAMVGEQGVFGFDPELGNMERMFDAALIAGHSETEIYIVGIGGLIAKYDGSEFTLLAEGATGEDFMVNQPVQSPGAVWLSPTGNLHYLLNVPEGENHIVFDIDAETRTRHEIDIMIGGTDHPARTIWGLDDENVWAGGSTSRVFDSPIHRWNGSDWVRGTLEFSDSGQIVGFWGSSAEDVWMATTGGELGGRLWHRATPTWELAGTSPETDGRPAYNGIWGTSNSNVFLATDQGLFRYDGTDWEKIDIGTDDAVLHIHGISATKLVVTTGHSMDMSLHLVEGN